MSRERKGVVERATHNTAEQKKSLLPPFFKDASIIVLFLTGLAYLLAYVLKSNVLNYYKAPSVTASDIGISYIALSFILLLAFIIFIFGYYMIIRLSLALMIWRTSMNNEDTLYKILWVFPFLVFFISVVSKPYLKFDITSIIDLRYLALISLISILILLILLSLNRYPSFRRNIKNLDKYLSSFIFKIKTNKYFKFFCFLLFLVLTIQVYSYLPEKFLVKQKEYDFVEYKSQYFVVVDYSKDKILVAPVDLKKKVITPHYNLIESNSKLDKPLVLKTMIIKGGLKVKELETN
ncbi:hypothetical protein ABEU81_26570 [Priestia megaterium]